MVKVHCPRLLHNKKTEVIGVSIKATLWKLRQYRVAQHRHADLASDYLNRAGKGVTAEQARNIGGTGNCPLTDYADMYETERRLMQENLKGAIAVWEQVAPILCGLHRDERRVIELYYNVGISREGLPELTGWTADKCNRLIHAALAHMETARCGR